ncbi:MAG: C40 family peptidase [Hyphomicrobiales bacterium]|nr:C40 family peptidase [Hyphomicrobiales bacterium]
MLESWIITEVRGWLGVPFHHQGRSRAGCDCIGLILGVAHALQLPSRQGGALAEYDRVDYGQLPEDYALQALLERHLYALPDAKARSGDVVLFRFHRHPQHVGLMSDYPGGEQGLIHCYAGIGRVTEHHLNATWQRRIAGVYRFAGSTNRESGILNHA